MSGRVPRLLLAAVDVPEGCRFQPRCPVAVGACLQEDPALRAITGTAPGHEAACILA